MHTFIVEKFYITIIVFKFTLIKFLNMENKNLTTDILNLIFKFQENEITEYYLYKKLSATQKNNENKTILEKIAQEEKAHHDFWRKFTQKEAKPKRFRIFKFYWIVKIFGLTFGIKLMENGEVKAQENYNKIIEIIPEAQKIANDEEAHENQLINLIHEEKLNYVGSIVLGLNDALVELTGALAGLSFALQNTKIIAFAGAITGIAASFSMAAAEYLSQRHEGSESPLRSASYTGAAYIATVILLILPYLIFSNYLVCLFTTIGIALFIIFFFNYYVSVAKDMPFRQRFFEMA